jgi:hypothetical protein
VQRKALEEALADRSPRSRSRCERDKNGLLQAGAFALIVGSIPIDAQSIREEGQRFAGRTEGRDGRTRPG